MARAQQVSAGGRGNSLVGISLSHLCRVFSKTKPGGPKAYVTNLYLHKFPKCPDLPSFEGLITC